MLTSYYNIHLFPYNINIPPHLNGVVSPSSEWQ